MRLDFDERDRESVVRDLDSADEEVRRLAVERVGVLPVDEMISHLVERLGDPSWRVRKAAVERLVACSETSGAGQALIAALGDGENPGRRNAAVEALIQCGARAVPLLIEASASGDTDVRKLAVDSLAGIGDERSVGPIIGLLDDPDPNVRAASADALGALGGEDAERALQRVATQEDEDRLVRFSALHALAALETPIRARDLGDVLDDPMLRPAGLALLGRRDEGESVSVLLKGLASDSRSSREAAMRSLLRLLSRVDAARAESLAAQIRETAAGSPELVDSAVERLSEVDLSGQLVMIQFLGLVRAEKAVLPILLAARDEALSQVALSTLETFGELAVTTIDAAWDSIDIESRRDACVLFGRTNGEPDAARLLVALGDLDPQLRAVAARSVGHRRLASGLAPLVRQLEAVAADDDFESEEEILALTEALIALAKPSPDGDSEITGLAIELLTSSLEHADESVRLAVARVLGRIGRRQDAQIVAFLLKDPSSMVRRAAVDALARLEPGTAAEPLRLALADESSAVRIAAAVALGASENPDVIEDMRRLAEDEDLRVRAAAVRAIGLRFANSPDPKRRAIALEVLDAALRDVAPVALVAGETLREVGGPEATRGAAMLGRAEPELVQEAIRCVNAHADTAALEALLPLVSHPDWSVRAEAIQTFADRRMVKAVPPILRRLETEQDEFVRGVILRALKRLEV